MAGFKDFREIAAWQLANQLKIDVDAFLARPNVRRRFAFCEQMSDAARSGPRNIAEGFARFRHKEFAQFVRIAKGSEAEVLNHFIDAHDQQMMTKDEFNAAEHSVKRALKAASGLIPAAPVRTRTHFTHPTHPYAPYRYESHQSRRRSFTAANLRQTGYRAPTMTIQTM